MNPFLTRRSRVEKKRWHSEAELDLLAFPPFAASQLARAIACGRSFGR